MTNSEARKRMQAASGPESALSRPQTANLGDGAIGLSEAEKEALAEACWLLDSGDPEWGWKNLTDANQDHHRAQVALIAPFVERIVREHTERALAEVEQRIEAWIRHGEVVPADVTTYDRWIVHEELRAIVRAARQEWS